MTSVFIGSTLIQSVDTPITDVVLLAGDPTLSTEGGALPTKDAISLSTTGKGEFAKFDTIDGGLEYGKLISANSRLRHVH